MDYSLLPSESLRTRNWSGGTSTELFIYPPSSEYELRNFQFRLSTATVDKEESDFTQLPGIARKLMILSGSITINHEDHYSRQLSKFDTDEFKGDWKTSSQGSCTDFNLMTTGKTSGIITAGAIEKDGNFKYSPEEISDWLFIYIISGKVNADLNNTKIPIKKGDLLVIEKPDVAKIKIVGSEFSEAVFTRIINQQ